MSYVEQTWNNGAAGGTPLEASRLRHMEEGIGEQSRRDFPAEIGAAITADDPDIVGPIQALIDASGITVAGTYQLPAPTGDAAVDSAAINAAILAAAGKVIIAQGGTYYINQMHNFPDGIDLRGQGGGSTSRAGRTVFKCTTAASGISISGGGGTCSGFEVDGNSVADTPFKRLGGLGANARLFMNIVARKNSAGNDLAHFYGAQNDLFIQCGFADGARDIAVFDQGFGGTMFIRCQWRTAGRYHHRYDNLVGGGVYAQPTDIHHYGGIMEGGAGTSLVIYNAAANITYSDQAYYAVNAPSGPMVDVVSGSGLSMHNAWIQCTTAIVAGSIGIKVRGTAEMSLSGRTIMQFLETGASVDGAGAFIYTNTVWRFFSVTTRFGATGGGTTAQIAVFQEGTRFNLGASTDFVEISQPLARDRFLYSRTNLGVLSYYTNTAGNFTPYIQLLGRGLGGWGVVNGTQQMLCTGAGTNAQRAAANVALTGALYVNTDKNALEWFDGAAWKNHVDHVWTAATTTGITTNPSGSGAPVGYTKVGGRVYLRGLVAGASIGATVLFNLPAGYRPEYQVNIPILTINGSSVVTAGYVSIATNGNVTIPAGAGAIVSFEGVSFAAFQ